MSTRWGSTRTKIRVDKLYSLDARLLARMKYIQPNALITWQWKSECRGTSTISIFVLENRIKLVYYADNEMIQEYIYLSTTPCNYGGVRYWFYCPVCNQRVAKLYIKTKRFLCRNCNNLSYYSSNIRKNKLYEIDYKIENILRKLGTEKNDYEYLVEYWPQKPKGMHNRTYLDLKVKLSYWRNERTINFIAGASKILFKKQGY